MSDWSSAWDVDTQLAAYLLDSNLACLQCQHGSAGHKTCSEIDRSLKRYRMLCVEHDVAWSWALQLSDVAIYL